LIPGNRLKFGEKKGASTNLVAGLCRYPSLSKINTFSVAPLGLRPGVGFYLWLRSGLAAMLTLGYDLSTASRPFSQCCFVTDYDLSKQP